MSLRIKWDYKSRFAHHGRLYGRGHIGDVAVCVEVQARPAIQQTPATWYLTWKIGSTEFTATLKGQSGGAHAAFREAVKRLKRQIEKEKQS